MATDSEERNKAVVREVNERMVRRDMTVYDDHPGLSETRRSFLLSSTKAFLYSFT